MQPLFPSASGHRSGQRKSVPVAPPKETVDTRPALARRATFGFQQRTATDIALLGHSDWLEAQLDPDAIDDSELDAALARFDWLGLTQFQLANDETNSPVQRADLYKSIRLIRAVHSKRQVFERVVEFWSNHFSVFMGRFQRFTDDRDIYRPMAFSRFSDLLKAVSKSVSMQAYLDNQLNVAGAPNENLAREILELHTLGVTGPYTETDVREFARVLTGWTFVDQRKDPAFGIVYFNWPTHDAGPKNVLGIQFAGGQGPEELDIVLEHLANHPATIDYVIRKMAQFFLGDSAPESAIERARRVWVATNGDTRKIVRSMLGILSLSEALHADSTMVRRPFDWLAALYRATGFDLPLDDTSLELMRTLGQAPFEWAPPDGYPFDRGSWVGLIQPRWMIAANFARAEVDLWSHRPADVTGLVAGTPRALLATTLDEKLAGSALAPNDVAEIQVHIDSFDPMTSDEIVVGEAIELVFSCPSFQVL